MGISSDRGGDRWMKLSPGIRQGPGHDRIGQGGPCPDIQTEIPNCQGDPCCLLGSSLSGGSHPSTAESILRLRAVGRPWMNY